MLVVIASLMVVAALLVDPTIFSLEPATVLDSV